jgi:hypothetical protein
MPAGRKHWRKVWRSTTRNRTLRRATPEHRWLWVVLLLIPDDIETGRLETDGEPCTSEDIADEAALPFQVTRAGLDYFIKAGMVAIAEDSCYLIPKYQVHQESPSAARMRKQRQTQTQKQKQKQKQKGKLRHSAAHSDVTVQTRRRRRRIHDDDYETFGHLPQFTEYEDYIDNLPPRTRRLRFAVWQAQHLEDPDE